MNAWQGLPAGGHRALRVGALTSDVLAKHAHVARCAGPPLDQCSAVFGETWNATRYLAGKFKVERHSPCRPSPPLRRNSTSEVTPCFAPLSPLLSHPHQGSGGAPRSAAGEAKPRPVPPKPAPLCAIANCNVTPAGPPHPAAPTRRTVPATHPVRGAQPSPTAERGLRRDEPPRAASPPHTRPRHRPPQRTGALAPAKRQPHPKRT